MPGNRVLGTEWQQHRAGTRGDCCWRKPRADGGCSATKVSRVVGQPILPSLSYPVFILTPPDILKTEAGQHFQPLPEDRPHHYPTVSDRTHPPPHQPGYEVSQFHSQDELGRVVYGFHGPDQSRMEARSLDGTVRGSYSYVDPNGNIVRMQYWDDGSGFHVTGNALPNGYPAYTPEVAAARAQHLQYYQAALQAAGQIPPLVSDGSDGTGHTSDSHNFDENISQFDKETNTNNLFEEDSDSVSLDNPELFGNFNYQEEEKKEEEKPSVSNVEGEVELGEDVGPDEDENEEGDVEGEHEVDEQQEQNYFRKEQNNKKHMEENKRIKHPSLFKVVKGNDVPKKFFNKQTPYQEKESENDDNTENEGNTETDDVHDDTVHDDEQVDEENHNGEEEEDNGDHHDGEEHEEGGNHEEEEKNVDENVDEHFDTVEHLFNPDEYTEESYRRADFGDGHGSVGEGSYSSDEEHSDAETAENRKSETGTGSTGGFHGLLSDQLFDKSNINSFFYQPKRAFFYHYLHTIPRPTERVDLLEDREGLPASNVPERVGQRKIDDKSPLVKSVESVPQSAIPPQAPTIKQPQLDSFQHESNIVRQSARRQPVTLFKQFTEVHDPQVSPYQASANPQLYPVYVQEKVR